MNAFQSLPEYETFVYTLPEHPLILRSTLVVVRGGARTAIVSGEIQFQDNYRLVVYETLNTRYEPIRIVQYGYEVWHDNDKLYWYDSQAHPNDPKLASTHPHHKHIPPDIKRNRIPAPGLSFSQPNLRLLIQEIEQTFFTH